MKTLIYIVLVSVVRLLCIVEVSQCLAMKQDQCWYGGTHIVSNLRVMLRPIASHAPLSSGSLASLGVMLWSVLDKKVLQVSKYFCYAKM